jgi:two-component system response regulator FixJ
VVNVVDDDPLARGSVCALVKSMGVAVCPYDSAEAFLEAYQPGSPGCLVTDFRMPGMSGVELQQELINRGTFLPVIVITAFARTAMTVEVVQKGAVTVLEKPYADDDLWDAIRKALEYDREQRAIHQRMAVNRRRLESLTESENEVLKLVMGGLPNKQVAHVLDVSIRTVENRRAAIFEKTGSESLAELIQLKIAADGSQS